MAKPQFTSEYRRGVAAAVEHLRTWAREVKTPQMVAREWESGVSSRAGDERTGFSDAIAAYLWGIMTLGEPDLDVWDPLEDLSDNEWADMVKARAEVSHG
jgi:hypothetical protein